jgi:ammonia channel protein AmtB
VSCREAGCASRSAIRKSGIRVDRGTSGLIGGNPQQPLIQLYGVVVTLVAVRRGNVRAAQAGKRLRAREHELEGLDISQHGEALQQIPYPTTFLLPSCWAELCPDSVLMLF